MEKCDKCGKNFDNPTSLEQHLKAKHENKPKIKEEKVGYSGIIMVVIASLIILIGGLVLLPSGAPNDENILDITRAHTNESLHIHPTLNIEILGEERLIPSGIGEGNGRHRIIHTHDSSGALHIEPPYPKNITLENFFYIWGRTFNTTCILDKCIDDNHQLKVYVNEVESDLYENVILKDLDKIRIVYSVKE